MSENQQPGRYWADCTASSQSPADLIFSPGKANPTYTLCAITPTDQRGHARRVRRQVQLFQAPFHHHHAHPSTRLVPVFVPGHPSLIPEERPEERPGHPSFVSDGPTGTPITNFQYLRHFRDMQQAPGSRSGPLEGEKKARVQENGPPETLMGVPVFPLMGVLDCSGLFWIVPGFHAGCGVLSQGHLGPLLTGCRRFFLLALRSIALVCQPLDRAFRCVGQWPG